MTQLVADVPTMRERPWLRLAIAFAALVAWVLITAFDPFRPNRPVNLSGAIADGPAGGILLAGLFLLVLTLACRWRDVGLNLPWSWRSLKLLWFPAIYLVLFVALDVVVGPPPLRTSGFIVLNATLAALSEEMMFRGVLFGALRTKLAIWPAALVTTLLFGSVHLLNVGIVGDFQLVAAQAVAAAMSGMLFIAIRVRTGSLLPGMVFHAAWDCALLLAVVGAQSANGGAAGASAGANGELQLGLGAVLLLSPNFLYALFLLRRAGRAKSPPPDTARVPAPAA